MEFLNPMPLKIYSPLLDFFMRLLFRKEYVSNEIPFHSYFISSLIKKIHTSYKFSEKTSNNNEKSEKERKIYLQKTICIKYT